LQVNLTPGDFPHARHTLPHQMRQWTGQVREVLLTVDSRPGKGRFAVGWEASAPLLDGLLSDVCSRWPHARVCAVDYSPAAARAVADLFFRGRAVPAKDFRGGPFYSYFFGLFAASQEYVLHADSDMLFGGGSASWAEEGRRLLESCPDLFACSPHPGPPMADGSLRTQQATPAQVGSPAFRFPGMSTRVFLVHRAGIRDRLGGLPLRGPSWRNRIKALVEGNPSADLPEHLLSAAMAERGLCRIDFLGTPPGMWSLHPPYRSDAFYRELPRLVERVERGDVPETQRGDHDVNDSMIDWRDARERLRRQRWWRRLFLPRSV
jgi:hypothetical protein